MGERKDEKFSRIGMYVCVSLVCCYGDVPVGQANCCWLVESRTRNAESLGKTIRVTLVVVH